MSTGKLIRQIRQQKKLSLRYVAKQMQTDPSYLSRIETDQQSPSLNTLERIASVLNCDVGDFFGDKAEIPDVLKGKVDWISFAEEMEDKQLTPDEIKKIIEVFEIMKGK